MFKALKINNEIGYKYGIAISYMDIGFAYEDEGHYNRAIKYLLKGKKIFEEIKSIMQLAKITEHLTVLYEKQNIIKSALENYKQFVCAIKDIFC